MSLKDKIFQDFRDATKSGDKTKRGSLSLLLAAIKNSEIEKRTKLSKKSEAEDLEKVGVLTDEEIIEIIGRQIKQRQDSADQFKLGQRLDLAEKEEKEMEIFKTYLPEQLTEEKIRELVKAAIAKTGAGSVKDMGRVMAVLMPAVKGRADGSLVSRVVKEELSR